MPDRIAFIKMIKIKPQHYLYSCYVNHSAQHFSITQKNLCSQDFKSCFTVVQLSHFPLFEKTLDLGLARKFIY